MSDSEAGFWEQAYLTGDYQQHWEYEVPSQELVAIVAAQVPAGRGTVLDVGCGAGREAVFLAQCGYDVIGIDISPKAIEIARQRAWDAGVEADFRVGSFFELPVEEQSIDFVNDRGALHLVREEQRPEFADEIFRVLKPGGRMLLRGASPKETEEQFTPITEESVDRHFPASRFGRGPLLPITLQSDNGSLDARLVVLTKRTDGD
jgi:ubiquinone/menaquinone biosynthesis C-methylase UbiE